MKQRASESRRLPASAWVFDGALALVAAGWPMAFFASMPVPSGVPVGMLAVGYALVLLHTLPLVAASSHDTSLAARAQSQQMQQSPRDMLAAPPPPCSC